MMRISHAFSQAPPQRNSVIRDDQRKSRQCSRGHNKHGTRPGSARRRKPQKQVTKGRTWNMDAAICSTCWCVLSDARRCAASVSCGASSAPLGPAGGPPGSTAAGTHGERSAKGGKRLARLSTAPVGPFVRMRSVRLVGHLPSISLHIRTRASMPATTARMCLVPHVAPQNFVFACGATAVVAAGGWICRQMRVGRCGTAR